MDILDSNILALLDDEYIGDDLTLKDLQSGYPAFVEEEKNENHGFAIVELE